MEQLTKQFYAWEKRGRGWNLSQYSVPLEPPFVPFLPLDAEHAVKHDRRGSSFLSMTKDGLHQRSTPEVVSIHPTVEIEISPPSSCETTLEAMSRLLESLLYFDVPFSFEIIGQSESVRIQLACSKSIAERARGRIAKYFPEAAFRESSESLDILWKQASPSPFVEDFGLAQEFMFPFRVLRKLDIDPISSITASLSGLKTDELGIFQVLFQSVRNPWSQSILGAVSDLDLPDLLPAAAREKTSRPIVAAAVRIGSRAQTNERAFHIAQSVATALNHFSQPAGNELIPLTNDGYPDETHYAALVGRYTYRSGMLLNLDELVSLVHVPSVSVRTAKWKGMY